MRAACWQAVITAVAGLLAAAAGADDVKYLYAGGWGGPNPPTTVKDFFDIAVGPDGNLYVLHEGGAGETYVQVFDPEGKSLRVWGGSKAGLSEIAYAGAIAVSGAGHVYVICLGPNYVFRFTAEGERLGHWTHDRWVESQSLDDVAVAPDGTVYVVDGLGRVDRFSPEGEHLGEWVPSGSGGGEAEEVSALAFDRRGRLYAATGGKRVRCCEQDGSPAGEITWDDDRLDSPSEIAVAGDGVINVSDGYRIRAFGKDGSVLGERDSGRRDERGEPELTRGLAVGPDGTVYVADYYRNDIIYFTWDGRRRGTIDATAPPLGYFTDPEGIAVSPDGTVYVADYFNRRVQYFTAEGEPLGQWAEGGDGRWARRVHDVAWTPEGAVAVLYGEHPAVVAYYTPEGDLLREWRVEPSREWNEVSNFAVAPDGAVYVVAGGYKQQVVVRFTPQGERLGQWGSPGEGPGEFGDWVGGVAAGPDGTVYVADGNNRRVQLFSPEGEFLAEWRAESGGWSPSEIAVGPAGDVYVAFGSQIRRLAPDGRLLAKWGGGGEYPGQFGLTGVGSLGVAPDGTVYTTDSWYDRVQYFRPGTPPAPPVSPGGLQYRWTDE